MRFNSGKRLDLAAVAYISTAIFVCPAVAAEIAQVPDLSGNWARNALRFEPPDSGPGPVGRIQRPRTNGSGTQLVFDHTSPLLTPQGAEMLKQRTDALLGGQIFPTLHDQCLPEPPVLALAIQPEVRILQQKDRVTFVYIAGPDVRYVRLNSQHPANLIPSWTGDSVGHYEAITYCVLGSEGFTQANDADQTESVETRLIAALETSYGLDARLVLLTLHAGLIHASVVERYKLTAE